MKILILKIYASLSSTVSAQFQIIAGTFGEFGSTQLVIRGIGIGNFPPYQITDAALHINTFYMTPSSN